MCVGGCTLLSLEIRGVFMYKSSTMAQNGD